MVDVAKAVIARLKKEGREFEVLVDCDKAIEFKKGKGNIDEVIATDEVFSDSKKGDHASEHDLERIFKTQDKKKVAEIIIKTGEIQLTTEHKAKIREQKRNKIIDLIHKNAIDPKTNLPHPIKRIELALEEAKVKIDEFKSAEDQIQDIVKALSPILPIKFETRQLEIIIPSQYAAQSYNVLKKIGKLLEDKWQNDGSLLAKLEIPAGLQEELESELNKLTHGDVEIKIIDRG